MDTQQPPATPTDLDRSLLAAQKHQRCAGAWSGCSWSSGEKEGTSVQAENEATCTIEMFRCQCCIFDEEDERTSAKEPEEQSSKRLRPDTENIDVSSMGCRPRRNQSQGVYGERTITIMKFFFIAEVYLAGTSF